MNRPASQALQPSAKLPGPARPAAGLAARSAGSLFLATVFLLFGSTLVHMLSEIIRLEDGYRWGGFGEVHGPGGTIMFICGGPSSVAWRTLPLYALLYFAICWQIARFESARLRGRKAALTAPWTCLLGVYLLESSRISSLRSLMDDLEHNSSIRDHLILGGAYLLCALAACFLGAWLAGSEPHQRPRLAAAAGWAGAVAFLAPVPYLYVEQTVSPVPLGLLMLLLTFVLTAVLFVVAFVRRRPLRGLPWLWLGSIVATVFALEL